MKTIFLITLSITILGIVISLLVKDPCYKKYYGEKGPVYEIKKNRVCMKYDHDRTYGISYTKTLEGADPETFYQIKGNYFADKNSVFYESQKLINVDPKNFLVVNYYYAKDNETIFYQEGKTEIDYDTFDIIAKSKSMYAKDKNRVYYGSRPIDVVDPSTFQYLGEHYFIDQYQVYYDASGFEVLKGTDPKTFIIFTNTEYTKDKHKAYYSNEEIVGADPETFKALSSTLAQDEFYVYFAENALKDLDVNNFNKIEECLKDSDSIYCNGKKLEGVSVDKFNILEYRLQTGKRR